MSVLDIDILMSNYQENVILAKKFIEDNYIILTPGVLQFRWVDGVVVADCDGEIICKNPGIVNLTNGKFRFGKVFTFNCAYCKELTSLEGCPGECRIFCCNYCDGLISLKGAPRECKEIHCAYCTNLTSLEDAPAGCKIII